ncbi:MULTISPECIES: hypothetical protein [Corynebacterium]|uniref:hypothetical protein n=1 Tax=Corynebacterium TaxID=1716 RepID=UPI0008A566F9|nr:MULTISPECIES: hypothetical protein [Corynebacterium]OFT74903.1 hypothetical protein HMPREF3104_09010 [Corynebacterium sp. HMSC30G07]
MFSSFGWGEFLFVMIIGLIVIGPERLPSVIEDVRAAIYAARKGIANAKKELNGELEGFGEFKEFKEPLDTVTKYAAMGPRRAMTSFLFESDEDEQPQAPAQPPQQQAQAPKREAGFNWEDVL